MRQYIRLIQVALVLVVVSNGFTVFSQEVQWAYSILGVSSRFPGNKNQYNPEQVLGKPNKLPSFGNSPCSWTPKDENGGIEFIQVGFVEPIRVQQIAIAENLNPGGITEVQLTDSAGNNYSVYTNITPGPIAGIDGRMFNIFIARTDYTVRKVKIILNTASVLGYNEIDAIGIADSKDSIKATIQLLAINENYGEKENLGSSINSPTSELLPVISPNGQTLFFTRQDHPENIPPIERQDIWFSKRQADGTFGLAQNLGAPLNNGDNNGASSITPDGQRMLVLNVYNTDGSMTKGTSISNFNGTNWGFPERVAIDSFYNDNAYGENFLANNGQTIVMTLERKDSEGEKDIHVSFRREDGTWTEPKNMGSVINTPESETSPFLSSDNKTLYFSSAGFSGYGSNDVFVTTRLDDTWMNWSEPQNLGSQINTSGWDAYFSLPANGEYAYFVSNTNTLGESDIFRQKLPKSAKPAPVILLSGRVLNAKTKLPMRSSITYKNLSTGTILGEGFSDSITGKFEIVLPSGSKYAILAEKKEFYSVNETVDVTKLLDYKETSKDLYMVPIEVGEIARLNNIFFDFNKADLKPESYVELNQLVKLLKSKPTLAIEIGGHTDDVGELVFNQNLSLKRAKSVHDYLILNGIEPERLSFKGFGETKPIEKGITDEIRQLNRRVEFLVIRK